MTTTLRTIPATDMRDIQRLGQEFDACEAAVEAERAAIVKFLRKVADDRYACGDDDGEFWMNDAANAIERGDHINTSQGEG